MYEISKNCSNIVIPVTNTRLHAKFVFRLDRKEGTKYSTSPYYKGTRLWDKLTKNIQESEAIFIFKNDIDKIYM